MVEMPKSSEPNQYSMANELKIDIGDCLDEGERVLQIIPQSPNTTV